mmetsp:Transcript_12785/g.44423  ORF Transcript_12785/g.44423 Transcript_12785/m.44423 type:complete len:387 (+) Transcript_12785:942-2102(+)
MWPLRHLLQYVAPLLGELSLRLVGPRPHVERLPLTERPELPVRHERQRGGHHYPRVPRVHPRYARVGLQLEPGRPHQALHRELRAAHRDRPAGPGPAHPRELPGLVVHRHLLQVPREQHEPRRALAGPLGLPEGQERRPRLARDAPRALRGRHGQLQLPRLRLAGQLRPHGHGRDAPVRLVRRDPAEPEWLVDEYRLPGELRAPAVHNRQVREELRDVPVGVVLDGEVVEAHGDVSRLRHAPERGGGPEALGDDEVPALGHARKAVQPAEGGVARAEEGEEEARVHPYGREPPDEPLLGVQRRAVGGHLVAPRPELRGEAVGRADGQGGGLRQPRHRARGLAVAPAVRGAVARELVRGRARREGGPEEEEEREEGRRAVDVVETEC